MTRARTANSIRSRLLGLFLLGLCLPPLASGDGRAAVVLHVRVPDALRTASAAAEIEAALARADAERLSGGLLELGGEGARSALVWRLGRAMSGAGRPVWVWLDGGRGGVVGAGQLELAILADASWITPGTRVRWDGPPAADRLLPEGIDARAMERERMAALWAALERRGGPTDFSHVFLRGGGLVRASPINEGRSRLAVGPAAAQADGWETVIEPSARGGTRGRLSGRLAAALGLVDGVAAAHRAALRGVVGGDGAVRTERVTVASDLDGEVARGRRLLAAARRADASASAALRRRIDSSLSGHSYERAVRERGLEALASVRKGQAAIAELERLAASTPELLRTPAPEQAVLPGDVPDSRDAWRRSIERLKRSLADLAARAQAQADG